MKKEFPNYRVSGVDFIEAKMPKKDKTTLDNFLKYCGINAGEYKLKDRRLTLLQIYDVMEKFDNISLDDIREFLAVLNKCEKKDWTKRGVKQTLKMFLKWHYNDWSARFNNLSDIKLGKVTNKLKKSELLTQEEIELMVRKADRLREKAYLSLLFELGCRPQEIRNLKWKDLKLDSDPEVSLYSGKTETARTLPIKNSVVHLKRWKEEFMYPDRTQNDYIFPSPNDRNKTLQPNTTLYLLKRVSKQAGITKNVHNYIFRHSRLNDLYTKLPTQIHRKYAGHTKDSSMTAVYEHLDNDDLKKAVAELVYNIEEIENIPKDVIDEIKKEMAEIKNVQDKTISALIKRVDNLEKKG